MNPLDCGESTLYKHLCELRHSGAPHSRGSGYLQACRLASVVAGTEHKHGFVTSKRLLGAAYGPHDGKVRKQRAGMTLRQLEALERYIIRTEDMLEKAVCGQILFCVYAQARWGDAQRLRREPVFDVRDGGPGVVEAIASSTKGQKGLKRLKMETPVVALAYGVTGARWWEHWKMARRALRLPHRPCLPCILPDRRLGSRAMTSDAASKWMRATLASLGEPETIGRPLGSHTCKATMLSWASRWGLAASARRALGHHLKPGDRMGVVYSRDHIIGPLGGLVRMIKAIRDKSWDPDCSRAVLLRASLAVKDAGGALGDAASFNFVSTLKAEHEKRGSQAVSEPSTARAGADLHECDANPVQGQVEEANTDDNIAESEPSDQSSTVSSGQLSDCMDYDEEDFEYIDEQDESENITSLMLGPYVNDKSGIVHEVHDKAGIARCGVVAEGFRLCKDLAEAVSLGVLCKRCYPLRR